MLYHQDLSVRTKYSQLKHFRDAIRHSFLVCRPKNDINWKRYAHLNISCCKHVRFVVVFCGSLSAIRVSVFFKCSSLFSFVHAMYKPYHPRHIINADIPSWWQENGKENAFFLFLALLETFLSQSDVFANIKKIHSRQIYAYTTTFRNRNTKTLPNGMKLINSKCLEYAKQTKIRFLATQ